MLESSDLTDFTTLERANSLIVYVFLQQIINCVHSCENVRIVWLSLPLLEMVRGLVGGGIISYKRSRINRISCSVRMICSNLSKSGRSRAEQSRFNSVVQNLVSVYDSILLGITNGLLR